MAEQVINHAHSSVQVLYETSQGQGILRLPADMQTTSAITPLAVGPGNYGESLLGSKSWYSILTKQAFVYHWGYSSQRISFEQKSLHCVPFVPAGNGPYTEGCKPLADAPGAPMTSDPSHIQPAPALGEKEGEYSVDHPLFGKYVRTSLGSNTYISVRLTFNKLGISQTDLDAMKPIWKQEIETTWNAAPRSSTNQKYWFEADWMSGSTHYTVVVFSTTDRPSMYHWGLDMSAGGYPVAAHEFGHHLGLRDGYFLAGEIPDVAVAMQRIMPRYQGKTFEYPFSTRAWNGSGYHRVITVNGQTRVDERIQRGALPAQEVNLMSGAERVAPEGTPNSAPSIFHSDVARSRVVRVDTVTRELIDAIEEGRLQKIYLDEADFLSRERYDSAHPGEFSAK